MYFGVVVLRSFGGAKLGAKLHRCRAALKVPGISQRQIRKLASRLEFLFRGKGAMEKV